MAASYGDFQLLCGFVYRNGYSNAQPILQAAFAGLIRVVSYGNPANGEIRLLANSASRLLDYPELKEREYVYLATCSDGIED